MNLVGKIFILLIFVMSLVFMGMAVAVYRTHENWRLAVERPTQEGPDKPLGLKYQLKNANARIDELERKAKSDEERYTAELKASRESQARAERTRDNLAETAATLTKRNDELETANKQAIAALDTATANEAKLTAEVTGLRQEIRNTQQDRDKQFATVVKQSDLIHQNQGELRRLEEKRLLLAQQVAKQRTVLREHDLSEDTPKVPPRVIGKVVAVAKGDMVEVDLGTDDGVHDGLTLEVFRGAKYLGKLEVLRTTPDRAVGRVIPGFKKGIIQAGDNVTTRFKVG